MKFQSIISMVLFVFYSSFVSGSERDQDNQKGSYVTITPGKFYTYEMAERGLHGYVWSTISVNKDGTINSAKIQQSSGSEELDKVATAILKDTRFEGGNEERNEIFGLRFSRTEDEAQPNRTCNQMKADYQFEQDHVAPSGEIKLTGEMSFYALVLLGKLPKEALKGKKLRNTVDAIKLALDMCEGQGDEKFLNVFAKTILEPKQ